MAGGLFPLRASRRRSSYHLKNSTALAALAVLGPASLIVLALAGLCAAGILALIERKAGDGRLRRLVFPRGATAHAALAQLLRDSAFVVPAVLLGAFVASRLGASYPLPLTRIPDVFVFIACMFAATCVLVLCTEVHYRFFAEPVAEPLASSETASLLPSDAPLYWLLLVVGFPLQLVTHMAFLFYGTWPFLVGLLWFVFLTVLHNALLRRRRELLQVFRELEVSQRVMSEGEIIGRLVHQSRHQLGLIGISTHQIREALKAPAPDRAKIEVQLERLEGVVSALRGILSEELQPRREEGGAEGGADGAGAVPGASRRAPGFVSLGKLVQDEMERLQGKAEQLGISLFLQAQTEGVLARNEAEAEQLAQGVFNVLDNALVAAKSRVTVSLARQVDAFAITVLDDGPGIPPEILPRAAEPFVTTKEDGSGMGLFIAQAAARRCGGELILENQTEGGLRATFWLPTGPRGRPQRATAG